MIVMKMPICKQRLPGAGLGCRAGQGPSFSTDRPAQHSIQHGFPACFKRVRPGTILRPTDIPDS